MIAASVHARVLGASFHRLSPQLQGFHDGRAVKRYAGRCTISSGRNWIARVICRVASLPRADHEVPVTVVIERSDASEISEASESWTRRFGAHEMRSVLRTGRHGLDERFGPIVLTFELIPAADRIEWRLKRARLLFMPLPAAWFAGCAATEVITDGRYHFDARASITGIGLLVHYKGWLAEHGR
jgi:Domain of unknown function (DUF4166)